MRSLGALLVVSLLGASCASASGEGGAAVASEESYWDSAGGNPLHPTHSYMAEWAVGVVAFEHPEVRQYQAAIVEGSNLEIHDSVITNKPALEALRREVGGNNWAADRPEILWRKAKSRYAAGDRAGAYRYVGVLLHYVQDMGVPAHAFHVIHQSSPADWDNLEVLAFFGFEADRMAAAPPDPALADPARYIEWSAKRARDHFRAAFPGATYHREFFPATYLGATAAHVAFLRTRQTDCAWGSAWALRAAARAFAR